MQGPATDPNEYPFQFEEGDCGGCGGLHDPEPLTLHDPRWVNEAWDQGYWALPEACCPKTRWMYQWVPDFGWQPDVDDRECYQDHS